MLNENWTMGPWQVKNDVTGAWEVITNIDEPEPGRYTYDSICDCDQDSKSRLDSEETKANARLIASSPELYENLTRAVLILDNLPGASINTIGMRMALAKARGEQ